MARWIRSAGAAAALAAGLLVVPQVGANAATAQQWQLSPPGGTGPAATVRLDTSGRLTLAVRRGGTQVLPSSAIGIRTTAADLSTGLHFTTRADKAVNDHYTTAAGKRRQHTATANQTTLSFTKGSSKLDVVLRVSADGVGYRYVVRQTGTVTVTAEASEFAVPASARAFLLPYDNGRLQTTTSSIPGTTTDPTLAGFPKFSITGYETFGDSTTNPIRYVVNNFNWNDVVSWP